MNPALRYGFDGLRILTQYIRANKTQASVVAMSLYAATPRVDPKAQLGHVHWLAYLHDHFVDPEGLVNLWQFARCNIANLVALCRAHQIGALTGDDFTAIKYGCQPKVTLDHLLDRVSSDLHLDRGEETAVTLEFVQDIARLV